MEETIEKKEILLLSAPKQEVTALDAVKEEETREVAYTIKDPIYGSFNVVKTANAWWMDKLKVDKLIDAFKSGHIIKSAKVYAGISDNQWRYFSEQHPDFSRVKEACEEVQMFKAMNTVNGNMEDPQMARWFLDRRHPKFAAKVRVESEILQPTINNNINVGNIININSGEVAEAIREMARYVFGADEESVRAISDEVLEGIAQEESK
jgi:hypothetical protein